MALDSSINTGGSTSGKANVDALYNLQVALPPIITPISISTPTGTVQVTTNGNSGLGLQLLSMGTGGTVVFEGSGDGTNWAPMNGIANSTGGKATGASAADAWQFDCVGVPYFRVRATALTSGTITGTMICHSNTGIVMLEQGTVSAGTSGSEQATVVRSIPQSSTLWVTATGAANAAVTLTIPSAGAGLFHYITSLEISRTATAALAGTATLVVTSTNLPGSAAWSFGNAMAAGGTQNDLFLQPSCPIKSSVANTNTTIVTPAPGAAVLWRLNASYYVGT